MQSDQPVDVVVLTKNSSKTIAPCLDAIRRSMDVKKLIVLDDSDDHGETLRIASAKADQVHVYGGNIGKKRDHAIDLVEAPVFAFVDSDVVVNRSAFLKSIEMLLGDDQIAAVANAVVPYDSRLRSVSKQRTRWSNLKFGFCLLRTSILKECRIPPIPFGEDGRTGIRLRKMGYNWLTQSEFYSWHLVTVQENWLHGLRYARSGYPWVSPKEVPLELTRNLFGILLPLGWSRRRYLDRLVFCMFVSLGMVERIANGGWPLSLR